MNELRSTLSVLSFIVPKRMLVKCVLLLFCYHQLLGGAVSEFTPTAFPAKISSQCGQYDTLNSDEQLLESLQQVKQQLPNNFLLTIPPVNPSMMLTHHLPQATMI